MTSLKIKGVNSKNTEEKPKSSWQVLCRPLAQAYHIYGGGARHLRSHLGLLA
ncbi:hypothetical protein Csa_012530 [Cucumis sativus]|uniref:Uncharacterized protein n=1 Tax=Cucumis sativus TaxID=3659 RepID=A0A0A0L3F7_CUCSA|nr:hypothetical protein Csa_012530 [Cucumis sativus]